MSLATYLTSIAKSAINTISNIAFPPSSKDIFVEMVPYGEAEWKSCFGLIDLDQVPLLPSELSKALEKPCPFWPDKKVKETHIAVWIPATVNKNPLLTSNLGKLLEPSKGNPNPATHYLMENEVAPQKGYWALITRCVIPDSSFLTYANQVKLLKNHPDYHLPRALEVGICMLMAYYKNDLPLFSHGFSTRCEEQMGSWPIVAGSCYVGIGKLPFVLELSANDWDYQHGIAAVRRFYVDPS